MMHVQLPDRKDITLREAVTAFVYGEPRDASSGPFYPSFASLALLEQLHSAAQAGRVRFRALKIGDNKYQEVEPLYFSARYEFDWNKNEIQSWGLADEEMGIEGEVLGADWHDVYLDREQFASLLRDMGVSVKENPVQNPDPDLQRERKTYKTGAQGRPTSRHFVEKEAQRRLDAGECPKTLVVFSEELANWLKVAEPDAVPMKPHTIENVIRGMWQRHRKPLK